MYRASENHDVFSSRITWRRKSKGERQGGTEETRGTCVPQASPRYNVWRIKVRLTGCLSSNYAPLQLVPACCRRRPRRGQIVRVVIMRRVYAPIAFAIFKRTSFNVNDVVIKTKWDPLNNMFHWKTTLLRRFCRFCSLFYISRIHKWYAIQNLLNIYK